LQYDLLQLNIYNCSTSNKQNITAIFTIFKLQKMALIVNIQFSEPPKDQ